VFGGGLTNEKAYWPGEFARVALRTEHQLQRQALHAAGGRRSDAGVRHRLRAAVPAGRSGRGRLTAFMLARDQLPPELDVLVWSSSAMTRWGVGSRSALGEGGHEPTESGAKACHDGRRSAVRAGISAGATLVSCRGASVGKAARTGCSAQFATAQNPRFT